MKKILDYVLAALGSLLMALFTSGAGVSAIFAYICKPALKAFYRAVKRWPAVVDAIDKIFDMAASYWPPEEE